MRTTCTRLYGDSRKQMVEIAGTDTEGSMLVECPIAFSGDERAKQSMGPEIWGEDVDTTRSKLGCLHQWG